MMVNKSQDPRLIVTRTNALDVALGILIEDGVLAVTHASVGKKSGISRSTLYRHWPDLAELRNALFLHAASGPEYEPKTNGPLRKDLKWILGKLSMALSESDWGQVAPQMMGVAATDAHVRDSLNAFMHHRMADVNSIFQAASDRGELAEDAPIDQMIEMLIALPYFRKFIAGLPLDKNWQKDQIDLICHLATNSSSNK